MERSHNDDILDSAIFERLFREKPQKKKKRIDTHRMSMPTTPMGKYDIFGDPTNLMKKTWETSEDHLLLEPVCHFRDFFEKRRIHSKPSFEERRL